MIPFDFIYIRPDTLPEALAAFREADGKGLNPMYYGGGTEIITMARSGHICPGAVIDLKAIPECNRIFADEISITVGSCATLSQIIEANHFPLLAKAAGRVADHTVQCKITLGGNIAGTIIYRESVLPLLLTDCTADVFGPGGLRQMSIQTVFIRRLMLARGEFLVRVTVDRSFSSLPYVHVKKTPVEKIGYPVVTVCALMKDGRVRAAVSGACDYPFRSVAIEDALNAPGQSREQRARQAIICLPSPVLSDVTAAGDYRKFVLYRALTDTLERLEA